MSSGRALHVVAVINGLVPDGAERSLVGLMPWLRERGVEVEAICLYRQWGSLERELHRQGFRTSTLLSHTVVGRMLELRRLLRAKSPDLIYTTIIESDILGRISAWGLGTPVVSSLVNTSYDPIRFGDNNIEPWKLRLVRIIDRFTARHMASGFHALTEAVAHEAIDSLGISPSLITVIGRGRDVKRLGERSHNRRHEARESLGLDDDHFVVIAVGRQEYQKGHVTLVEAISRLRSSRPQMRVLLVGRSGSETERIERRIRELSLENVVLNLGHRDDVPEVLAASDLFAFPSLFEGFGGSLVEAMAIGVPAVVSDLPALREVGGECVRYVARGAVGSWATALGDLLDDRIERERLAVCARARAQKEFDIERIADAQVAWLRKMADCNEIGYEVTG